MSRLFFNQQAKKTIYSNYLDLKKHVTFHENKFYHFWFSPSYIARLQNNIKPINLPLRFAVKQTAFQSNPDKSFALSLIADAGHWRVLSHLSTVKFDLHE